MSPWKPDLNARRPGFVAGRVEVFEASTTGVEVRLNGVKYYDIRSRYPVNLTHDRGCDCETCLKTREASDE